MSNRNQTHVLGEPFHMREIFGGGLWPEVDSEISIRRTPPPSFTPHGDFLITVHIGDSAQAGQAYPHSMCFSGFLVSFSFLSVGCLNASIAACSLLYHHVFHSMPQYRA